jgi:SAM-dependent methyltransferase
MKEGLPEVPHSRENAVSFFVAYVAKNRSKLSEKLIVDLSAGSGYIINEFLKAGAKVKLYDLFPSQNTFCHVPCEKMDLQKTWPIEPFTADVVICAETIEHLPDQHFFFKEVSRILKPGGTLILTTPNSSSLRSRFSQFLMESEHYSNPAPNERDAYTKWPGSEEGYFSKLFVSGVLRLRTLAALHQLKIKEIHRTHSSSTSLLLLAFYPLIYFFSRKHLRKQLRLDSVNAGIYREIFKVNTSLTTLLSKHLILEFTKQV